MLKGEAEGGLWSCIVGLEYAWCFVIDVSGWSLKEREGVSDVGFGLCLVKLGGGIRIRGFGGVSAVCSSPFVRKAAILLCIDTMTRDQPHFVSASRRIGRGGMKFGMRPL